MNTAWKLLKCFQKDDENFLHKIIPGDEICISHMSPRTKGSSWNTTMQNCLMHEDHIDYFLFIEKWF